MSAGRIIFALAASLGIIIIGSAAAVEMVRYRRGQGSVGRRQFRLRMVSAVVWLAVLFINLFAVVWLWPKSAHDAGSRAQSGPFLVAVACGLLLLCLGLALLFIDMWQVSVARRLFEDQSDARLAAFGWTGPVSSDEKKTT